MVPSIDPVARSSITVPSRRRGLLITLLVLLLAWPVSFLVVFDLTTAAYAYDEENDAMGRSVACGPRPRWMFSPPSYAGIHFDGREWPFVVFSPLCDAWLHLAGYVPSARRRRS